jgi:flagellar assembly factor FliW
MLMLPSKTKFEININFSDNYSLELLKEDNFRFYKVIVVNWTISNSNLFNPIQVNRDEKMSLQIYV